MTDLARQALTKLPDIAKGIKNGITGVAKQVFTLDMQVLDDAIDDEQIMNSIIERGNALKEGWEDTVKDNIDQNMDCDHLKEIIIKNFKEFIDEKIFHSHFHSRNRKTNDTNSLSVFYRHGISKIITKMVQDVKQTNPETDFFNDEIIKVMEKLEYETFQNIIQNEFENTVQVESKQEEKKEEDPPKLDFINSIIDEKAENDFLNSPLITQDMKEELFYELFKDDFKDILSNLTTEQLNQVNFETKEKLQDFYDRIEFKQQDKIEQLKKEELQKARQKGIFSMFTKTDKDNVTVKTEEVPIPKKNKTTYVTEDSNLI